MTESLVKRLRAKKICTGFNRGIQYGPDILANEAADAIDALTAEFAMARTDADRLRIALKAARADAAPTSAIRATALREAAAVVQTFHMDDCDEPNDPVARGTNFAVKASVQSILALIDDLAAKGAE